MVFEVVKFRQGFVTQKKCYNMAYQKLGNHTHYENANHV